MRPNLLLKRTHAGNRPRPGDGDSTLSLPGGAGGGRTTVQPRLSERILVSISNVNGDRVQRKHAMKPGAKWHRDRQLWKMSVGVARLLNFLNRILAPCPSVAVQALPIDRHEF